MVLRAFKAVSGSDRAHRGPHGHSQHVLQVLAGSHEPATGAWLYRSPLKPCQARITVPKPNLELENGLFLNTNPGIPMVSIGKSYRIYRESTEAALDLKLPCRSSGAAGGRWHLDLPVLQPDFGGDGAGPEHHGAGLRGGTAHGLGGPGDVAPRGLHLHHLGGPQLGLEV